MSLNFIEVFTVRSSAARWPRWGWGLLFLAVLLFSCSTNPVSGKKQLVLMSEEEEIAVGQQMDPEVIREYGLYDDEKIQDYINEIGQSLVKVCDRQELIYRFRVVNSPIVNAFALPGGYIFITRGILAYLNDEAELAGVLGHELGHVTARHAVAQMTKARGYSIGAELAGIFVPGAANPALRQLSDILAYGIMMGYGRDNEYQADSLGIKYESKIEYNPTAVARFLTTLQRIESESGEGGYHGFFATHPETKERIERAKKLSAEAIKERGEPEEKYHFDQDQYIQHLDGLMFGDDPKDGLVKNNVFTHPVMRFEIVFPVGWKIENNPEAVVAKEPKNDYFLQLTAVPLAKKATLEEIGKRFSKGSGLKLREGKVEQVNNLESYIGHYTGKTQKLGAVKVEAGFFILSNQIFTLLGYAKEKEYDKVKDPIDQTVRSFRELSKDEAREAVPTRIKILTVEKGGTPKEVLSSFDYDEQTFKQVMVINAMKDDDQVPAGKLLKVLKHY